MSFVRGEPVQQGWSSVGPLAVAAFAAAIAAGACAGHAPVRRLPPAVPEVARAEAPPPPPRPESPPRRRPCGGTDREYESWIYRTFGGGYEAYHDGPEPARIRDLVGEPRLEAERMLRRGLGACSTFAVSAIARAGWRDFVPDLARAVAADNSEFRAHVILALKALGHSADLTDELVAVLSSGSTEARMTAAMGARQFALDRLRRPLLDRVRQDPSWLVRVHAAESLYELADIYPRDLNDHPAIAAALHGDAAKRGSLLDIFGLSPPLTADERARLAIAADQLDAEITERLSARCSKPVPLTTGDLHVISVHERPFVTLTVEASIGPCERKLAFVAFLESPGGFRRPLGSGVSGHDPVKLEIDALPRPVTVVYSRATGVLTVGTFALDTAKANVAVLSAGPNGVAARYQGTLGLTFERHGRPPSTTGIAFLDFQPEIAMAVRTLLDRTPELRGLVRGAEDHTQPATPTAR